MELESKKQARLIKQYELNGYYVVKLLQTNKNGIPDLMLLKDGVCTFVEVKREGCKLRPLQKYRKKELEKNGFKVIII